MPIERHHRLITVAGVRQWIDAGVRFQCRYDLVALGKGHVSPSYNCIYLQDGQEYILVATNARGDGTVDEREIRYWPGLVRHHEKIGDGSKLVYDPSNHCVTSWIQVGADSLRLSTTGKVVLPATK